MEEKKDASPVFLAPERAYKTASTELAAALVALGFDLLSGASYRLTGDGVPGGNEGTVTWAFASRSNDGRYSLQEALLRWDDDAWLSDPENRDPLAFIITAFRNKRRLVDQIKQGVPLVVVQQGERKVILRADAPRRVIERAERFLS